jgi:hypothetical protein
MPESALDCMWEAKRDTALRWRGELMKAGRRSQAVSTMQGFALASLPPHSKTLTRD